jgi:glutaconyl-CoA decarboxylase
MRRYQITIEGKLFDVEIVSVAGETARVVVNGRPYEARFTTSAAPARPEAAPPPPPKPAAPPPPPPRPTPAPAAIEPAALAGTGNAVLAPMPGSVLDVLVKVGDAVKIGDTVVKLEAMKMENDIKANVAGVVAEVRVAKGSNVSVGEVLLVLSPG